MADEVSPAVSPAEPTQLTGVDMTPPIDVKDAVRIGMDYFKELFGNPFIDLSLEEVQRSTQGQWLVTVGYSMARGTPAGTVPIPNYPRMFKQITIDGTSGQVISMKVYKF